MGGCLMWNIMTFAVSLLYVSVSYILIKPRKNGHLGLSRPRRRASTTLNDHIKTTINGHIKLTDSQVPQIHSLKPQIHSLKPQIHSLQPQKHSLKPQIHSLKPHIWELQHIVLNHNLLRLLPLVRSCIPCT